jgi:hypothetical protein
MADILGRRALSPGRLAGLGATLDFHHGLLTSSGRLRVEAVVTQSEQIRRMMEQVSEFLFQQDDRFVSTGRTPRLHSYRHATTGEVVL